MPLIKTFAELLLGAKHCSEQGKGVISVFRQQGVVFRDADVWLVTTGYYKLEIKVFSRSPQEPR